MTTLWNIETNDQQKVAGPYTTIEAALEARHCFFPVTEKLFVVEYELNDCPKRALPKQI